MGYNGAPTGERHCDHSDDRLSDGTDHPLGDKEWVGFDMYHGHCVTAVHAEMNAVADCARRGVSCDDATAYITKAPCENCRKLLVSAGIARIVSP
jgi:deoxycytidylate deaminase